MPDRAHLHRGYEELYTTQYPLEGIALPTDYCFCAWSIHDWWSSCCCDCPGQHTEQTKRTMTLGMSPVCHFNENKLYFTLVSIVYFYSKVCTDYTSISPMKQYKLCIHKSN